MGAKLRRKHFLINCITFHISLIDTSKENMRQYYRSYSVNHTTRH